MHHNRREFTKRALLAGAACIGWTHPLLAVDGVVHVVQRGDTLSGISRRYGVSTSALRQANRVAVDAAPATGILSSCPIRMVSPATRLAWRNAEVLTP